VISVYSGQQELEERDVSSGAVKAQYVWSAAQPLGLVLVDKDADNSSSTGNLGVSGSGLEQRLYVVSDIQGSTTAVVNAGGAVQERYTYSYGGVPHALQADFTAYTATSTLDANASRLGFDILYEGQRWHGLFQGSNIDSANGGGLYEGAGGRLVYDPSFSPQKRKGCQRPPKNSPNVL
jgi:hypothetical protein